MRHCNMSQRSSQAVVNGCCAPQQNGPVQPLHILQPLCLPTHLSRQVSKFKVFYGQSVQCVSLNPVMLCVQSSSVNQPRCPNPYPSPTPHPTPPQPINTSQSPLTDGRRGQQGLAGAGRGLAKVRPGHGGVWDCCDMACLPVNAGG